MSSRRLLGSPALRRALPWVLYAAAAAAVVPLARTATGLDGAPAVAEARRVAVSCPRTAHRLWVKEVLVAPGDAVAAGQALARMAPGEVELELADARRRLGELELAAARVGPESERLALELGRLAADVQQDRSELAQLDAAIAQGTALLADGLGDFRYLSELKLRRAGLLARTRALGGAAARGGVAGGAQGRAAPAARASPSALAAALAAVEAQRDVVQGLEGLRDRLELRAPFAGRVEAVLLRAGESAAGDAGIVTVVEERPEAAVAWIDERRAIQVRAGDRVTLAARDGAGPRAQGRVVALGPSISELPARFWLLPSRPRYGRAVYVRLDAPAFLPGQALQATFHGAGP